MLLFSTCLNIRVYIQCTWGPLKLFEEMKLLSDLLIKGFPVATFMSSLILTTAGRRSGAYCSDYIRTFATLMDLRYRTTCLVEAMRLNANCLSDYISDYHKYSFVIVRYFK